MKNIEHAAGSSAGDVNGAVLAEWWRRLVAVVIDTAVLWAPMWVVTHNMDRMPRTVISVVVGVIYFALLNGGAAGQTLGKMALGIRVRDAATGGPVGPSKAALRYIVPALLAFVTFGLVWLLDGLWPLWDRRRQALHDKLAGSVVVNAKEKVF